jgi:hypothetical protein
MKPCGRLSRQRPGPTHPPLVPPGGGAPAFTGFHRGSVHVVGPGAITPAVIESGTRYRNPKLREPFLSVLPPGPARLGDCRAVPM